MSHTNSTSHYSLPQFVGTDIPTWLGDFNSAMTAIDNGINSAATSASGAATTAEQALTDAAAAASSATSAYNAAVAAQKAADDAANRCPFPIGYGGFFQTDPNTIYAGTRWEQKKDVFILASGATYGAGSKGGEAQHKLTESELPQISGNFTLHGQENGTNISKMHGHATGNIVKNKYASTGPVYNSADSFASIGFAFGGNQPHNNMPPYFAMPFWIRTA